MMKKQKMSLGSPGYKEQEPIKTMLRKKGEFIGRTPEVSLPDANNRKAASPLRDRPRNRGTARI
jgi:hypothetical protein